MARAVRSCSADDSEAVASGGGSPGSGYGGGVGSGGGGGGWVVSSSPLARSGCGSSWGVSSSPVPRPGGGLALPGGGCSAATPAQRLAHAVVRGRSQRAAVVVAVVFVAATMWAGPIFHRALLLTSLDGAGTLGHGAADKILATAESGDDGSGGGGGASPAALRLAPPIGGGPPGRFFDLPPRGVVAAARTGRAAVLVPPGGSMPARPLAVGWADWAAGVGAVAGADEGPTGGSGGSRSGVSRRPPPPAPLRHVYVTPPVGSPTICVPSRVLWGALVAGGEVDVLGLPACAAAYAEVARSAAASGRILRVYDAASYVDADATAVAATLDFGSAKQYAFDAACVVRYILLRNHVRWLRSSLAAASSSAEAMAASIEDTDGGTDDDATAAVGSPDPDVAVFLTDSDVVPFHQPAAYWAAVSAAGRGTPRDVHMVWTLGLTSFWGWTALEEFVGVIIAETLHGHSRAAGDMDWSRQHDMTMTHAFLALLRGVRETAAVEPATSLRDTQIDGEGDDEGGSAVVAKPAVAAAASTGRWESPDGLPVGLFGSGDAVRTEHRLASDAEAAASPEPPNSPWPPTMSAGSVADLEASAGDDGSADLYETVAGDWGLAAALRWRQHREPPALTTRIWPLPTYGRMGELAWDHSIRSTAKQRGGSYVDVNGQYDLLVRNAAGVQNVLTWKQVVWCAGVPYFVFADNEEGAGPGSGVNASVTAALRPRLVKAMSLHFQNGAKRLMSAYIPDPPLPPSIGPADSVAGTHGDVGRSKSRLPDAADKSHQRWRRSWRAWVTTLVKKIGLSKRSGASAEVAGAPPPVDVRAERVCVCRGQECTSCIPVHKWLRRVANSGALGEQIRQTCKLG